MSVIIMRILLTKNKDILLFVWYFVVIPTLSTWYMRGSPKVTGIALTQYPLLPQNILYRCHKAHLGALSSLLQYWSVKD